MEVFQLHFKNENYKFMYCIYFFFLLISNYVYSNELKFIKIVILTISTNIKNISESLRHLLPTEIKKDIQFKNK